MHIKNLINTDFIPLVPSDTVSAAIAKVEAWQAYNIPVIEPATKKVVGTIHYGDLPEDLNEETVLTDIRWQPAVTRFETEHLFEAARFMIQSEEHTSELQSRGHLVCRLLLENKKKETV